mmetsp:Transcript_46266/g.110075  ORF Transcript_46266/g.110075 Transcript_46266/m.110075 type:complete len:305 (-) Transcript_46266:79-993(-)
MVDICVKESLTGDVLCELVATEDWSVKQLQRAISRAAGIPIPEQRLLWRGGCLRPGDTVSILAGPQDEPHLQVLELELIRVNPAWHRLLDTFLRNGPMLSIDRSIPVDDGMRKQLGDRSFAVAALQEDGLILGLLAPELQADRELVSLAVRQSGAALQYAATDLQGDREVVLLAVQSNGLALRSASGHLQADRGVVLEAVQENGEALQYASTKLQEDQDLALQAIQTNGAALRHSALHLQQTREFVVQAVQKNPEAFYHVLESLRHVPEIVAAARGNAPEEVRPQHPGLSLARRAAPFVAGVSA